MTISDILWGILAPALLAGVFFFWPAAVFTSRTSLPGALARILGIGAPLLLVFVHFFDWPSYPPKASLDRFFYAVIATMMLSFIHAALKDRPRARPLMPMLFASSIGVPLLILWSQLSFSTQAAGALSTTASWCWVFGAGLAIGVLAIAMDHLAERAPGAGIPLTWWAVSAGTSVALLLSASAKGGQLSASLAGAFGAAVVASWIWPAFSLTPGGGRLFAGILGGLVLFGYHFAKLPALSAVLLLSAPLFGWLVELKWFEKRRPWQKAIIRLIVCALPLGLAVFLALQANPIEENPYG